MLQCTVTSDQWSSIGAALPGFIIAATALMTAGLAALNNRKLSRVERKVDGNLARLAEHLERARQELVALEGRRHREVTAGKRELKRASTRKPAAGAGREKV
jgi:hypothetical protein